MKKKTLSVVLFALLLVPGAIWLKSTVLKKNAPASPPQEKKEVADYYRGDVYKFKPSDFDSEPFDFPLSNLVDRIAVVRLDNENDDALLNGRAFPIISESYIGVQSDDLPFKLFDRATRAALSGISGR